MVVIYILKIFKLTNDKAAMTKYKCQQTKDNVNKNEGMILTKVRSTQLQQEQSST